MKASIKKILFDCIFGTIFWSVCLTPFALYVLCLNTEKYIAWLISNFFISSILTPIYVIVSNYLKEKLIWEKPIL